jgi:hypothetical protein
MKLHDIKLFFMFTIWGWIIFVPYISVSYLCFFILNSIIKIPTLYSLLLMIIPTFIDLFFSMRIIFDGKYRVNQYKKLIKMYNKYNDVPKKVLYELRMTKCERLVEKQFEHDSGYRLI